MFYHPIRNVVALSVPFLSGREERKIGECCWELNPGPRQRAVVVAQVVSHRTTDQQVPVLIPAGSWAFFSSLYPIRSVSLSGHSWRCITTNFPI